MGRKRTGPVTSPVTQVLTHRYRELLLLFGVTSCAFALVSLAGFHPDDPTWLRPGTGRVTNPCGPLGALVADALLTVVGKGAWALFVPMVLLVLAIARRPIFHLARWTASAALFVTTLALADLLLGPGPIHPHGGLVGAALAGTLQALVGTVGAGLVLLAATLMAATVLFRIDWARIASWAVAHAEAQAPVVRARLGTVGRWGASWIARGMAACGRVLWGGVRHGGLAFAGGVGRTGGVLQRMGRSLTRSDLEPDESVWDDIPSGYASELPDEEGLGEVDETEDRTAVAVPAAVVEVEWDTTSSQAAGSDVLGLFPDLAPRDVHRQDDGSLPTRSEVLPAQPTDPGLRRRPAPPAAVDEPPSELDAPEPRSLPSVAAVAAVPSRTAGHQGVMVHQNALLGQRVTDDGRALSRSRTTTFELPPLGVLDEVPEQQAGFDEAELRILAQTVEEKLGTFNIGGKVTAIRPGPVVTIFEFLPDPGIKVSRIANLADDLAMALCALRVRIVAPIPGKGVVGIEIPSKRRLTIYLREVLASSEFRSLDMALPCILGKDVEGRPMVADLAKMPHLLIGGTTGSGKSVGVNGMLMSLLFTKTPDEMRMLLVDPKMLEFELYEDIPHLLHPVVTEPKGAAAALAWACREMDDRYRMLARWGTRNIVSYNKKVEREVADWTPEKARRYAPHAWDGEDDLPVPQKLPYIVIIIDELADLMMVASKEVEESVVRIAQKARACGIHLIIATQRPSTDVVTGLIKANMPTRISFQLRSSTDSRVILDQNGAEALLGKGDMLYLPPGVGNLKRCHAAFVSDEEVARVTGYLRDQAEPDYIGDFTGEDEALPGFDGEERDDLFDAAVEVVVSQGKASTSMVQRHLKIGYNRAARIIDMMEAAGIVGPADGARPREVLTGHP